MNPEKANANEILAAHGPAGWLVRRLQRYALLGWGLAAFLLCAHFLIVLASTLSPRPVVVVDQSGRVLGNLEYLKPDSRSDQEILAASMQFATLYMSLNSATIFEDYAAALNLMVPELRAVKTEAVEQDDYLSRVEAAKSRSWLEFSPKGGAQIVARRGLNAQVRLTGNIVVDGGAQRIERPFDLRLEIETVARNSVNTAGIVVLDIKDN